MRLDTLMVPAEVDEGGCGGRAAVVIDVLRSTTSMAAALDAGCREMIPTAGIEEASRLAENLGRSNVILCGERDGRRIEGFDLGNSPGEFVPETVRDRTLIMATSNGTPTINKIKGSSLLLLACFNNISTVYQILQQAGADVVLICAGKQGRFCLEDLLCAGALADLASRKKTTKLGDGSQVALAMYRKHRRNLSQTLAKTQHGAYLVELGFEKDIDRCALVDSTHTVPVFQDGRIVRYLQ